MGIRSVAVGERFLPQLGSIASRLIASWSPLVELSVINSMSVLLMFFDEVWLDHSFSFGWQERERRLITQHNIGAYTRLNDAVLRVFIPFI